MRANKSLCQEMNLFMRQTWKKNLLFAIKIVVSACTAICVAQLLNLQFAVSAGIVAILSVALTKKETLKIAMTRFFAFGVALLIAYVCYSLFGFVTGAFLMYLLFFIVICQFMKWNNAMAMDSVLISHFLSFGNMKAEALLNEILLFVIGVGIGIVANLFLRKKTDYMERLKDETDEQIKRALHRMSLRIMDENLADYDGSCFTKLNGSVDEALTVAMENDSNQFGAGGKKDIEYILMRRNQIEVLHDMYQRVSLIHTVPVSAKIIADFFEKVSVEYARDNSVSTLLEDFNRLDMKMKEIPLPVERREFEDRAQLYALMRNMEQFLNIKKNYVSGRA